MQKTTIGPKFLQNPKIQRLRVLEQSRMATRTAHRERMLKTLKHELQEHIKDQAAKLQDLADILAEP